MQDARESAGRVVVGVDGSERNVAALEWAVADAVRRDRPLHLVSVACKATTPPQPWTEDSTIQYSVAETQQMIERARRRYGAGLAEVTVEVPVGVPSKQLVKTLRTGDELVVGRRGIGPAERVILGSTSIEAAGRSPVPTVIVPDDWDQAKHASGRVVAGVDGTERDEARPRARVRVRVRGPSPSRRRPRVGGATAVRVGGRPGAGRSRRRPRRRSRNASHPGSRGSPTWT